MTCRHPQKSPRSIFRQCNKPGIDEIPKASYHHALVSCMYPRDSPQYIKKASP